ncbi:MAG TPA: glycosyltransferase family 87 protein [Blastocatellia bacterium]|nr:glycosyltransferase family 87 protein [Blastocatellia bacterium]
MPLLKKLRPLLIVLLVAIALASIKTSASSLAVPDTYLKDFMQEYLLAKAAIAGINPYLPLPELAHRFISPPPEILLQHPTPHPPPVAVISLPLVLLRYEQAAAVWFGFEIGCIFVAAYLLLCGLSLRPGFLNIVTLGSLALCWHPFWEELVLGQINTLLLVLLLAAWIDFRSGRDARGGIWLGLIIALKVMAWPIAIFMLLKQRWYALIAIALTVVGMHLVAMAVIGINYYFDYYRHLDEVMTFYRYNGWNISLWSIGYRLFEGTQGYIVTVPLFFSPFMAKAVSIALPLLLLIVALVCALRSVKFDTAFGILVGASLLVNPVAWTHYLTLLTLPVALAVRDLLSRQRSRPQLFAATVTALLLLVSRIHVNRFSYLAFDSSHTTENQIVGPLAGMLLLVPVYGVLGVMWCLWRWERTALSGDGAHVILKTE